MIGGGSVGEQGVRPNSEQESQVLYKTCGQVMGSKGGEKSKYGTMSQIGRALVSTGHL